MTIEQINTEMAAQMDIYKSALRKARRQVSIFEEVGICD